jgi:hypothetical protein
MLQPRPAPEIVATVAVPPTEVATLARQVGPEPTNKVAAATIAGGGSGAAITVLMTTWGGPAIIEMLGPVWVAAHPAGTQVIVGAVSILVGLLPIWLARLAAYNVLDAPNIAMVPAPSPTAADIRAA